MPNFLRSLAKAAGELWDSLDVVPDCPACGGKGVCDPGDPGFNLLVWWKGHQVYACMQCDGRGKV